MTKQEEQKIREAIDSLQPRKDLDEYLEKLKKENITQEDRYNIKRILLGNFIFGDNQNKKNNNKTNHGKYNTTKFHYSNHLVNSNKVFILLCNKFMWGISIFKSFIKIIKSFKISFH